MRVLIVNTSERIGGAAIAANRLMEALKKQGVKAKMMVRDRQTDRLTVVSVGSSLLSPIKFLWERFVIFMSNRMSRRNLFQVDIANAGTDITQTEVFKRADVVHLHWVNQGFLSLADIERIIRSGKRVVVTMHDQWYFTGVCHYSGECVKYRKECNNCELMNGTLFGDKARKVFARKQEIYKGAGLTFVGCSRWIADLARTSKLTEGHEVVSIPNAIDTDVFCVNDRMAARFFFGLPQDKRLLLFSCQRITDERKGFRYLVDALNIIKRDNAELAERIELVVVGGKSEEVKSLVPFNIIAVPYISETDRMVALYNAIDLYVTPSLQDNLPNTIVESMACGVPCVGFHVGGIPEMIDHKVNGYVADYCSAESLAEGIAWSLTTDHVQLSENARSKAVETYSETVVAKKYIEVYGTKQ